MILSFLIYLIALFFPAFHIADEKEPYAGPYIGFMCLLVGWMSAFTGSVFFLAWLGNVFYFAGILFTLLRKNIGFYFSGVALILSPLMFLEDEIMVNEGGTMKAITSFDVSAYLWIGSLAVLLIASSIQKFKKS